MGGRGIWRGAFLRPKACDRACGQGEVDYGGLHDSAPAGRTRGPCCAARGSSSVSALRLRATHNGALPSNRPPDYGRYVARSCVPEIESGTGGAQTVPSRQLNGNEAGAGSGPAGCYPVSGNPGGPYEVATGVEDRLEDYSGGLA